MATNLSRGPLNDHGVRRSHPFGATVARSPIYWRAAVAESGFIAAALAFDALKATLLIFAGGLLARRKIGMVAVTVLLWCGCLAWSSASAVGFAMLSRGEVVASRAGEADARQAAEARVDRIEAALKAVPAHRSAAVIAAAINAEAGRDPVLWRQTKDCANATKPASAEWCRPVLAQRAELASAERRESSNAL